MADKTIQLKDGADNAFPSVGQVYSATFTNGNYTSTIPLASISIPKGKYLVTCTLPGMGVSALVVVFYANLNMIHFMSSTTYQSTMFFYDAQEDTTLSMMNSSATTQTVSMAERGNFQAIRIG